MRVALRAVLGFLIVVAVAAYLLELYGSYQDGLRYRPQPKALTLPGASTASLRHAAADGTTRDLIFESKVRPMGASWTFSAYDTQAMRMSGRPPAIEIRSEVPVALGPGARIDVTFNGCSAGSWRMPFSTPLRLKAGACKSWPYSFWRVAVHAYRVRWRVHGVSLHSSVAKLPPIGHIERAERLGSEAWQVSGNALPAGNVILLDALQTAAPARASWRLPSYEFSHLGSRSTSCGLDLYVIGNALKGAWQGGSAQVFFNGRIVARIAVPHRGAVTAPVFFTPLYRPVGIEVPIHDPVACAGRTWNIAVRVQHASWWIERVGVVLRYVPPKLLVAHSVVLTATFAALIILTMLAVAAAMLRIVLLQYGKAAAAAVLAILAISLVTHDQWDFPVWVRFANLLAFGNGNPALMWAGTPLWPMLVSLLTPVQMALYSIVGTSSAEVPTLLLKFAIAQAGCWTAYLLSRSAPAQDRKMFFWMTLLSPMALYDVAAGYREIVAALLAAIGMSLSLRRRFFAGVLVLTAAGSVSEALLPLILLPAALRLSEDRRSLGVIVQSGAMIVLAAGAVLAQWLMLPAQFAETAIAFRAHSYRYGEGSWLGLLTTFNVVPQWVGASFSTWITLIVFVAIAAAFAVKYARVITDDRIAVDERPMQVVQCVAGLVFAFFLSYSGADISTWWALIAVTMYVFYKVDPLNPYPLLLSSCAAACQYAVAGTRDFVSWTFLWPQDKGLFGILGQPMHAFAVVVVMLIAAGMLALLSGKVSALFSRTTSPYFGGAFALAGFAVTVRTYPLDVVFCFAVVAVLSAQIYRLWRRRAVQNPWQGFEIIRWLGTAVCAAATVAFAGGDAIWTLVGIVLTAMGFLYGMGLCDVALVLGTLLLMRSQVGSGWVSFSGYSLLLLGAVVVIAAIATRRFPLSSQNPGEQHA